MGLLGIVTPTFLLTLLVAALAALAYRAGLRRIALLLFAAPPAVGTYLGVGIAVARFLGGGHFFSLPFGGYRVRDRYILLSLACWLGLYGYALHLFFRSRGGRTGRRP